MKFAKILFLVVLTIVLVVVLAGCYPATAQAEESGTLSELLARLGTSAGIGAAIYFILESLPYVADEFDKLDRKAKRLIVLVLCFAIPGVALAVGVWREYYILSDDAIFQALAAGFEAFTVSQAIHTVSIGKTVKLS